MVPQPRQQLQQQQQMGQQLQQQQQQMGQQLQQQQQMSQQIQQQQQMAQQIQQQQQMSLQAMRAALSANTTPMMYAPTAEYGVAETFVPPMLRRPQAANPVYPNRPQTVSPVVDPNFTAI